MAQTNIHVSIRLTTTKKIEKHGYHVDVHILMATFAFTLFLGFGAATFNLCTKPEDGDKQKCCTNKSQHVFVKGSKLYFLNIARMIGRI